jgi:hypothetical protein
MAKTMELDLWNKIMRQPTAVKRFLVVVSIVWIVSNSITFNVIRAIRSYDHHALNEYIAVTYIPVIVIYGLYWIISGIKRPQNE